MRNVTMAQRRFELNYMERVTYCDFNCYDILCYIGVMLNMDYASELARDVGCVICAAYFRSGPFYKIMV